MEKALVSIHKIEKIEFLEENKTAYKAAKKECSEGTLAVGIISGLLSIPLVGMPLAISLKLAIFPGLLVLMMPAVFIGPISGFITKAIMNKYYTKRVFENPEKYFEWCLSKAVAVFNARARVWNHWIEGQSSGYIEEENKEYLERIYNLLQDTRKMITRGVWLHEGVEISTLSTDIKLTELLTELSKAEERLLAYTATLQDSDDLPAIALLENESALLELETEMSGLLPEKI